MEPNAQAIRQRLHDALVPRAAALTIAAALLMLGLYPSPALVVLSDPAWRTDYVARQLAEERAYWIAGLLVIVGPAMVLANLAPHMFDRLWNVVRTRLGSVPQRWYAIGVAVLAGVLAVITAGYVLSNSPSTSDEVAQLWHARILLSGRLWLPADPNPEFFALDNIIDRGRWYSQFPIGGPAALALATLLHVTWLLNPLLAGLTVVNVYRFGSQAYDTATARVSTIFCATCPFLLVISGSYMNHMLVVFLATLALAELPAWSRGTHPHRSAIVIGLSLGAAIAVRPLDGAIATLALGVFVVVDALRNRRLRPLLSSVLAGALPVALLLVTNWLTTGNPLLFGYEVLWGANHSLGFHDDPAGNPHTPARALLLATAYLTQLNWSLFGWPIAGLLIVSGALVAAGRVGQWSTILLVWITAQLFGYALYWHSGVFFGPRYLVTVVPAFLLIAAHGLVLAERKASPVLRRSIVTAVAASALGSWLIPSPPVGALGAARGARPLRSAFKMQLEPVVRSVEGTKALVFVSETASSRLVRRLWGLGISRPDAARLVATKDNCALFEASLAEAQRVGSAGERLSRLEQTRRYAPSAGVTLQAPDASFRISGRESVTPRCRDELLLDGKRGQTIAYGMALLQNEIGSDGRITGPVVFVADLGERNELLRGRYSDRPWYRLGAPAERGSRIPRLVPYE